MCVASAIKMRAVSMSSWGLVCLQKLCIEEFLGQQQQEVFLHPPYIPMGPEAQRRSRDINFPHAANYPSRATAQHTEHRHRASETPSVHTPTRNESAISPRGQRLRLLVHLDIP